VRLDELPTQLHLRSIETEPFFVKAIRIVIEFNDIIVQAKSIFEYEDVQQFLEGMEPPKEEPRRSIGQKFSTRIQGIAYKNQQKAQTLDPKKKEMIAKFG